MTEFEKGHMGHDDHRGLRNAWHPYFGLDAYVPFPDRHPDIFRGWITGPTGYFDDNEVKDDAPGLRDLWEPVSVSGGETAHRNMDMIMGKFEHFEHTLYGALGEEPESVLHKPWRSGVIDGYGVVYKQTTVPYGFARELLITDSTRPDGVEAIIRLGSDTGYHTSETVLDVRVYKNRIGSFYRRDEPLYAMMFVRRYPSGPITGEVSNARFNKTGKNPYYNAGNFVYDISELMEKSHAAVFG